MAAGKLEGQHIGACKESVASHHFVTVFFVNKDDRKLANWKDSTSAPAHRTWQSGFQSSAFCGSAYFVAVSYLGRKDSKLASLQRPGSTGSICQHTRMA
eukprot:1152685-Pelagomonas_calceolata.AAC.2